VAPAAGRARGRRRLSPRCSSALPRSRGATRSGSGATSRGRPAWRTRPSPGSPSRSRSSACVCAPGRSNLARAGKH
jgi:hypothetical protein